MRSPPVMIFLFDALGNFLAEQPERRTPEQSVRRANTAGISAVSAAGISVLGHASGSLQHRSDKYRVY